MNFEKNEFMLVVDSTNGLALWDEESTPVKKHGVTVKEQVLLNVEDSISIEHLDEKWSVDKKSFLEKIRNGTEAEYKDLWKQINQFWERRDKEGPEGDGE